MGYKTSHYKCEQFEFVKKVSSYTFYNPTFAKYIRYTLNDQEFNGFDLGFLENILFAREVLDKIKKLRESGIDDLCRSTGVQRLYEAFDAVENIREEPDIRRMAKNDGEELFVELWNAYDKAVDWFLHRYAHLSLLKDVDFDWKLLYYNAVEVSKTKSAAKTS